MPPLTGISSSPPNDGEDGQRRHGEGGGHGDRTDLVRSRRRLVAGRCRLFGALGLALLGLEPGQAALALGREEQPGARAVGRREPHRHDEREQDEPGEPGVGAAQRLLGGEEDALLGEEPHQRRQPGERGQTDGEGPVQRAPALGPATQGDERGTAGEHRQPADREEEQRLEERVGEEVPEGELRRLVRREAERERAGHDGDLAERGVRQHPLDVSSARRREERPRPWSARRARRGRCERCRRRRTAGGAGRRRTCRRPPSSPRG